MASTQVVSKSMGAVAMLAGVGLFVTMFATNPRRLGPAGVTLWFICLWLTMGIASGLALHGLSKRWSKQPAIAEGSVGLQRSVRRGALLATGVCVLLGLSSLGQLDVRDIGLVMVLLGLTELYMRTRLA